MRDLYIARHDDVAAAEFTAPPARFLNERKSVKLFTRSKMPARELSKVLLHLPSPILQNIDIFYYNVILSTFRRSCNTFIERSLIV
jgi:hypothetical protein